MRRRIAPKIGTVVSLLEDITGGNYYHNKEHRRNQLVGRVEMDEGEFEKVLHRNGYTRNPAAWLKQHTSGEIEEGSWRKKDGNMQVHLIFYDGEHIADANTGELFLYAHWEYAWDERPWKHLVGEDAEAAAGVTRVRTLLQEEGIDYEYVQPG